MKKIIILSLLCLFLLQPNGCSAVGKITSSGSLWPGFFNICRNVGYAAQTTLTRNFNGMKNINWAKINTAKAGIIAAVTATALYGMYRFSKHFFRDNKKNASASTSGVSVAPVQSITTSAESLTPPGLLQVTPIGTTPVVQQAGVVENSAPQSQAPAAQAPALPAVEAAQEELATVPYFADKDHHVIDPVEFDNPDNQAHVIVQQIRVLNQFEPGAGGAASCGYQAGLKNLPALAGLIQGHNTGAMLTDPAVAQALFDSGQDHLGRLRAIIIKDRMKIALQQFYQNKIEVINPDSTRVVASIYQNLVKEFLNNSIAQSLDSKMPVSEITKEVVVDAIADMPIVIHQTVLDQLGWTAEQLTTFLHDKATIGKHIKLEKPFCVTRDDIGNAMTHYDTTHRNPMPGNGEMLESEEIKNLIGMQRKYDDVTGRALDQRTVSVHTIESCISEELNLSEEISTLRDQIKQRQLPQKKIHAFVLGSADQCTRMDGHWITMVLELAHNRRRYTIADSADNHIRMFDGACHNLIRYLEGDKASTLVRPADSFKQRLTQQLKSALDQYAINPDNPEVKSRLYDAHAKFGEFVKDYSSFGGKENFDSLLNLF